MDKYGILKHYFGYDSFRTGQEKLVDAILAGQDVLGIKTSQPAPGDVMDMWDKALEEYDDPYRYE